MWGMDFSYLNLTLGILGIIFNAGILFSFYSMFNFQKVVPGKINVIALTSSTSLILITLLVTLTHFTSSNLNRVLVIGSLFSFLTYIWLTVSLTKLTITQNNTHKIFKEQQKQQNKTAQDNLNKIITQTPSQQELEESISNQQEQYIKPR